MTPATRPALDNAFVAPRGALETRLAGLWEEVLATAPIGADDDFFDLGGASLQAFAIIARVHRDLGVVLTPRDLFTCATVAAMAALIADRSPAR
ncbi:MAG: phosphopantetheine-binding protein [Betaproteobacteria bacterium]